MDTKLTISKCKNADYEIRSFRLKALLALLFYLSIAILMVIVVLEIGPAKDISPMVKYSAIGGIPAFLYTTPVFFLMPFNIIISGHHFVSKGSQFKIINSKTGVFIHSSLGEVESCCFMWGVDGKMEMNVIDYGEVLRVNLKGKKESIETPLGPLSGTLDEAVKTLNDFFGDKVINPKRLPQICESTE